jgi:lipoprotein-anchoring transpeptidase ErfK/SrfK
MRENVQVTVLAFAVFFAVFAGSMQAQAAGFYPPPVGMTVGLSKAENNGLTLHRKVVRLDAKYMRQVVPFRSDEPVGTIIVMTGEKFLYLILGDGKAMRYGGIVA